MNGHNLVYKVAQGVILTRRKNNMKRNVLLVLCFSMSLFAVGDELMQKDYQNDHRMPLVIDVPYYEEGKDSYEIYEQTLQPGDYYQSGKGENGYVFKQYGLMPELASNVMSMENKKVIKIIYSTLKKEKKSTVIWTTN